MPAPRAEPVLPRVPPRRLSPLTPVVRAPLVLLAVVGASWQQLFQQGDIGVALMIALVLLGAGAVYGVASWLRTTYWIDGTELRIDTGVIVRQSRRIRIDRLQGVDIVQPLVARLLGLAELRFDVASGSEREGVLAFLPHSEAVELRRLLLDRRDDLHGEPAGPAAQSPERLVARLDLPRLLASLVLSTEGVWVAVTAFVMAVAFALTGSFAVVGGLLPALLGLGLAVTRRLMAYYGFTLTTSGAGLQVRRGLTSLSSQTITLGRIQGVVVSEPLLWRRAGWARLDVSLAGYERTDPDAVQASSTVMPVAPREEVLALAAYLLRADPRGVPLAPTPRRARWLAPLSAWTMALGQDPRLLVARRGWWVRRLDAVPQARVQSLRLLQGPLQRRLGLAHVVADSPPGPVRLRGEQRDAPEARAFLGAAVALGRAARQPGSPSTPTADTTQ